MTHDNIKEMPNCHANYPAPFILHVCIDFINQKYIQNNKFDTNKYEFHIGFTCYS